MQVEGREAKSAISQMPIFQPEQITHAVELSLGIDGPEKIELITADPESAAHAGEIQHILQQE